MCGTDSTVSTHIAHNRPAVELEFRAQPYQQLRHRRTQSITQSPTQRPTAIQLALQLFNQLLKGTPSATKCWLCWLCWSLSTTLTIKHLTERLNVSVSLPMYDCMTTKTNNNQTVSLQWRSPSGQQSLDRFDPLDLHLMTITVAITTHPVTSDRCRSRRSGWTWAQRTSHYSSCSGVPVSTLWADTSTCCTSWLWALFSRPTVPTKRSKTGT